MKGLSYEHKKQKWSDLKLKIKLGRKTQMENLFMKRTLKQCWWSENIF
jgi:hypothetical protein